VGRRHLVYVLGAAVLGAGAGLLAARAAEPYSGNMVSFFYVRMNPWNQPWAPRFVLVGGLVFGAVAASGLALGASSRGDRLAARVGLVGLAATSGGALGVHLANGWVWWSAMAVADTSGDSANDYGMDYVRMLAMEGAGAALGALTLGILSYAAVQIGRHEARHSRNCLTETA
jgi:hypothetical protein